MKIKMNFKKEFTHGAALSNAMELSPDWKNHISDCNGAQVNFLSIDNKKIIVNDVKNNLLDDELWRKGIEEKSKLMLGGNSEGFMKKSKILKSDNFVVCSNLVFDLSQLQSVECARGTKINLDSNTLKESYSSGKGISTLSKKIGKMSYD